MKNIVLIGMRGTGKSRIAEKISDILKIKAVDIDSEIEKSEGKKISQIIKEKNWEYFREIEKQITKRVSEKQNIVISTGGGVVLDENNIKNLKKNGIIIFLFSKIESLKKRIEKCKNRPSLNGQSPADELEEIWEKRKDKYYQAAEIVVDVSAQSNNKHQDLFQKAEKILELIQNKSK